MIDTITLEVLRAKLEAIADDGARTVVRTAISPIVSEAKDCSCAIYGRHGDLIVGGGTVEAHFHTGVNGVEAINAVHGDTIAPGDLFLVNDPYSGGGFHAQDVFIHQPVFHDGELVAWIGSSAHMMDMGGGAPGSFVPAATECYQEAIRFPPVRLYRQGVEQGDVWSILRNNIRISNLVEMDMRSLISGSNVIRMGIEQTVAEYGLDIFQQAVAELARLSEQELRRRIRELTPGRYSATGWAEWTDADYCVPCTLTIEDDVLVFDYAGAAPQTLHYYNSKPYVIESLLGVALGSILAQDLPFNEGIFRGFEIRCPKGSILDAQPPAPIGGPHLEVGCLAVEVALQALNLAISASPRSSAQGLLAAAPNASGMAVHGWSGKGFTGQMDSWLMLDGAAMGPGAGSDRDSDDFSPYQIAKGVMIEFPDTEITEAWYPIRIARRGVRPGPQGAGKFRAGHGVEVAYTAVGDEPLYGIILGNRERIPIAGMAGGFPGGLNEFEILCPDGARRQVGCHQQGVLLFPGELFIVRLSSGGGWGDPLDRDPLLVEEDVATERLSLDDARSIYGVEPNDPQGTAARRRAMLADRLARATPPSRPVERVDSAVLGAGRPLYPGVEDHEGLAISVRSGAVLARQPDDWVDGCAVIHDFLPSHPMVDIVAYLDPLTGHTLVVDIVRKGVDRGFASRPDFWTRPKRALAAE